MKIDTVLYMPDGNRRFARKNGISLDKAYYLGGKTLKLFSQFFVAEGRSNRLIFHAMSDYTYERTDSSLNAIYEALRKTFKDLIKEKFFEENGIVFRAVDHSRKLPKEIEKITSNLEESNKNGKNGEVITLLGYSLERDINQALSQNPKDYNSFRKNLIFPDIDLVIRPYEMRLSGGPVYAMAQSQMIVLNKFNPEVRKEDLEKICKEHHKLKEFRIRGNLYHKL